MSPTTSRNARGIALALIAAAALLFAQCSKSSPTSPTPATPTVASVTFTINTTALFKKGATAQLTATGTMSTGGTQDVTSSCTNWLSDNVAVATISPTGMVTAQGSGSTTFVATCSSVPARMLATLSVVMKSTPLATLTSASLGTSTNAPFLPMVIFKMVYSESSKAFGYDVTFMSFSVRSGSGATLSTVNFGPDMFVSGSAPGYKAGDAYVWPAWGTAHVDASGNRFACFVSNSYSSMPSSVVLSWATQVRDDMSVVTNFASTSSLTPNSGTYSCDETHGVRGGPFVFPMPAHAGTGRSF